MKAFFDSSALAKRYVQESGTQQVNDVFLQTDQVFASMIALPEIISALTRKRIEKDITREQFDEQKKELLLDFQDYSVCDLTQEVLTRTIQLIEQHSLRTLDAIHLASAMEAKVDVFVSSDVKQMKAAAALKLKCLKV
jgi:uncharacterized protein